MQAYGPAAAAGPTTSSDPAELAGGYLARQLKASGGSFYSEFGGVKYGDWGLTLDAVMALDAAGVGQGQASAATAQVAAKVRNYLSGDTPGELYAGATGKTLNAAIAQQVDPTNFGGVNLVTSMQSLETVDGRFSDKSAYGDYSNIYGQSFGILGLERAGVGASAKSVAFLRLQQCTDGGWGLNLSTAGCSGTPDADSTAMAVQALIAAAGASDPSVKRGLDWLAGAQKSDGSFGGGTTTESPNANSTGLAGQALLAGGRTAQARNAVHYLSALQYGCDFPSALRGGVAYNAAAYNSQKKLGAKATTSDQDRRSTAQAALALAGVPLGVVTAAGASSNAPSMTCAAPTSSTSATGTAGPGAGTASWTGAGGTAGTHTRSDVVVGAGSGSALPRTGADVFAPIALGLLLLVLGAAAVTLSRRRGLHT